MTQGKLGMNMETIDTIDESKDYEFDHSLSDYDNLINKLADVRTNLLVEDDHRFMEMMSCPFSVAHYALEKLRKLEAQLLEANKVIGFYNCHTSKQTDRAWDDSEHDPKYFGEIPCDDFEILQEGSDSCNLFLGKRAREYLDKHKTPE